MEKDTPQQTDTYLPEDEQFEIRPWVKYAAIGLGLSVLVAVEFATYQVGYGHGYGDATASGEVKEKVNAIAASLAPEECSSENLLRLAIQQLAGSR